MLVHKRWASSRFNQRGYSLVEVLVAITVLLIALVGPLTIAHTGLKRSLEAKDNTLAVFLAQEGIEAVVKLREDDALGASGYDAISEIWRTTFNALHSSCSDDDGCGITINESGEVASVYSCDAGRANCVMRLTEDARVPYKQIDSAAGSNTLFTRYVQINVTGDSHAQVRSTVSWTGAHPGSVTLESYVYNIYYEE